MGSGKCLGTSYQLVREEFNFYWNPFLETKNFMKLTFYWITQNHFKTGPLDWVDFRRSMTYVQLEFSYQLFWIQKTGML